jgi:wyosine [tRNA(Phe)-imidazoG37] synthetase (radical SAM superfamily)
MFVHGPVDSPRLGRTLEVRPIPPRTCSYSCIFCPYGRTDHLRVGRRSFYPPRRILDEILDAARRTNPDYVRFTGSGEPTLCRDLGLLIRGVKEGTQTQVAISTNASLLFRKDVRQDIEEADVILPSLDAGSEEVFLRINRPHCALDFDRVLEGLARLRREFTGPIWLESMLVGGVNDGPEDIEALRRSLALVEPDQIHILRPVLPPAEPWVRSPSSDAIARATQRIRGARLSDAVEKRDTRLRIGTPFAVDEPDRPVN